MTDLRPPQEQSAEEKKTWFQRLMEKWWGQLLVFAGGLALYLLLGLLLWWVLNLYINPQDSAEKKDLVQALALIMAGVAGAIGIFFTWRGQSLARETQEYNQGTTQEQLRNAQEQLELTRKSQAKNQENTLQQLEYAQEELRLTRQGQITERFTRGIDQLGNKSLDIRLGGIYALERIARESNEDHWPIMEVLTAFVRQRATREALKDRTPMGSRVAGVIYEPSPELDIQAILKVLSRRIDPNGYTESARLDLQLDLHFVALPLADLSGADLRRADLSRANLQGADLSRTDLSGADLREANLWKANLHKADLRGADVQGAYLHEAKVTDEQLADALTLQGVTMPDGQEYEDWLIDKEGSEKDVENQ